MMPKSPQLPARRPIETVMSAVMSSITAPRAYPRPMTRTHAASGSPYEQTIGFSRAVRVGQHGRGQRHGSGVAGRERSTRTSPRRPGAAGRSRSRPWPSSAVVRRTSSAPASTSWTRPTRRPSARCTARSSATSGRPAPWSWSPACSTRGGWSRWRLDALVEGLTGRPPETGLDLDAASTPQPCRMRTTKLTLPLYLGGAGLSLFGNAAIAIVLPWLVISRTGDPSAAAVVAAAAGIASVPATLFSRTADRPVRPPQRRGRGGRRQRPVGGRDRGRRRHVRAVPLVVRRARRRGRDLRRPRA